MLPEGTHIGHVELKVSRLDRALAFYRDLLGFRVIAADPAGARLSASGAEPARIVLRASPLFRPRPPRTAGLFHVAILFPSRRDLALAVHRLLAHRYPLEGASDHLVSEALYLSDPDGNGLELYADRPREQWVWEGTQLAMATLPLDLRGLLALAQEGRGAAPALPTETCIGHVHLSVSDLGKAEAFYHGALGLAVMQRSYPGALFLAAGGYHHHLGANTWASRGAPPAPADAVGLAAFSFVVPDAAALAAAGERLRAAGYPVASAAGGLDTADSDGIRLLLRTGEPAGSGAAPD